MTARTETHAGCPHSEVDPFSDEFLARPDEFDIRRKVAGHLGYGTGVHNCVGQVIARMEGEAVFRALARRISSWHLAGEPRPRLNNSLRGLDTLPVTVEPA